ncbi:MAG TPA: hypothetical protein VE669_06925 [Actinomycetota bacterium]|jgi:hypothetical protein|nr:hypothetical protein [Actinomycetota bacterium]
MLRSRPEAHAAWLERAFALFLVLHGLAHTVGTSAAFKDAEGGRTVELLGGLWSVSSPLVLRALGVTWALAAAGYFLVAAAYWVWARRRRVVLVAVTVPSLVLAVATLWAAVVGAAIDVILLGMAWWTRERSIEPVELPTEPLAPARAA